MFFCSSASKIALYESILASPHRTMNAEEADYFYVPVLDACLITRADDAPHLRMDVGISAAAEWHFLLCPFLVNLNFMNNR